MGGCPPVIERHEGLWKSIEHHAEWLGLKYIRLEMAWRQFEPLQGQYDWSSPEMLILDRICQWAENHGSDVLLQCSYIDAEWACFDEFRGDPALQVYSAPKDLEHWAQSWVILLRELVLKRGYRCIKWIHLVNEPACTWWFLPETPDNFYSTHDAQIRYLGEAYRVVGKAVRDAGIPVKLMGPGETDMPNYADISGQPWFEYVDDVDFHGYCSNFDWDDPNAQVTGKGWGYRLGNRTIPYLKRYAEQAHKAGKGLFLTEFGTQTYGSDGSDPAPGMYKASLKDTEQLIRCLNIGVDGLNKWGFVNRGDIDGQWQYIDTWNSWPKVWMKEAKPHLWSYYMLGQATRHLPMKAKILETTVEGGQIDGIQRVFAACAKSPKDGSKTLLVVNDAFEPVSLNVQGLVGQLQGLFIDESKNQDSLTDYRETDISTVELAPFGMAILTDTPLDSSNSGRR